MFLSNLLSAVSVVTMDGVLMGCLSGIINSLLPLTGYLHNLYFYTNASVTNLYTQNHEKVQYGYIDTVKSRKTVLYGYIDTFLGAIFDSN